MRDPARVDRVIALLRRAWRSSPDLRLGQLIHHVARQAYPTSEIFHVEDDLIEIALHEFLQRRGVVAEGRDPQPHGSEP